MGIDKGLISAHIVKKKNLKPFGDDVSNIA
jgi:hypothetical protein